MENQDSNAFKDALDAGKELDKGIKLIVRIHKLGFAFFRYSLTTIPLRLRIINWILFSWALYNLIITFSKFPDGYQNAGAGDDNWFDIIICLSAIIGNCIFEIIEKGQTVRSKLAEMENFSDIFNIFLPLFFLASSG